MVCEQDATMRETPPMSNIDIYQVLRKIPNVSDDEAKQAADLMAGVDQAATKADIGALRADLGALQAATKADLLAQDAKRLKLAVWAVAVNVTLTVTLTALLV